MQMTAAILVRTQCEILELNQFLEFHKPDVNNETLITIVHVILVKITLL